MPHIVIEHDSEIKKHIDLKKLANSLHQMMAKQETVSLEALKTRTIEVSNVIIGNGSDNKMIHIDVQLLTGRSEELKRKMGEALFFETQKFLEAIVCSLSVNVRELGVYKKF